MRLLAIAVLLTACSFDTSGAAGRDGGGGDDDDVVDAGTPDADVPPSCTPDALDCDGRVLRTCNAEGDGYAAMEDCDFTCVDGACVGGSNLDAEDFAACTDEAPELTPPEGATITLKQGGNFELECDPHCGDGVTTTIASTMTITQSGGGGDLAVFCLAEIDLPEDAELRVTGEVEAAIALVVDGAVVIDGTIDVSGKPGTIVVNGDAIEDGAGGLYGPSGTDGSGGGLQGDDENGGTISGPGRLGSGLRPGSGGLTNGDGADTAAGGGGGGAYRGLGGNGGDGTDDVDGGVGLGAGGLGGLPAVGSLELVPLVGGSGGGGGADSQGGICGLPGGGGGGALQISARLTITIAGGVRARGGDGVADPGGYGNCGAGGGGSGGALLLEAKALTITGLLDVDGGDGGESGAGDGGLGANGSSINGANGADGEDDAEGGAGGGGGGGRIRLNAATAPSCSAVVTPTDACSAGVLE